MTSLDNYVTKTDLSSAVTVLKAEMKAELAELRAEIHALDARLSRSMVRQTWAVIGAVVTMGAVTHFFH